VTFIKRSVIYIKRNAFYTIVLTLLISLLGALALGAYSAFRMVSNTEENLWSGLSAVVFIEEDLVANELHWDLYGEWPAPEITREMIEEIASLPYVRHAEITINHMVYSDILMRYWDSEIIDADHNSLAIEEIHHIERFEIKGISDANFTELSQGIIRINSGSSFTQEQLVNGAPVVLISQEFANMNNLSVGGTLILKDVVTMWPDDMGTRYDDEHVIDTLGIEFEVIGIYTLEGHLSEFDSLYVGDLYIGGSEHLQEYFNMLNLIYLPFGIVEHFIEFSTETFTGYLQERTEDHFELELGVNWRERWEAEWGDWEIYWEEERISRRNNRLAGFDNFLILNDTRDLPAFHDATSELLPEFIMARDVTTNGLSAVFVAMDNIRGVTSFIVIFLIGASVLLLSFLMILLLQTRKSEIGIYLALGEKKRKVALQFIAEALLVTIVSLTLSLFIHQFFSSRIAHSLAVQEMGHAQVHGQRTGILIDNVLVWREINLLDWFVPEVHELEELVELHNTQLEVFDILVFYGVATIVVISSTLLSALYIMRLKPREILLAD